MKILLAPAEIKNPTSLDENFLVSNLSFKNLQPTQLEVIEHYDNFISSSSQDELSKWFGLKKLDDVKKYTKNIKNQPTLKAIQRYIGVAFEALDYQNLLPTQQQYCDDNILIFSNLFGVLKANDLIPDYKYKQGAKLPTLDVEKLYKKSLKDILDSYLEDDEIIDLRAAYYDKFYKINKPYLTMKFIKNGKVVSHWAKHYRGMIVNIMAKNSIQSIAELMDMPIPDLIISEIRKQKFKTEIIYTIQ